MVFPSVCLHHPSYTLLYSQFLLLRCVFIYLFIYLLVVYLSTIIVTLIV